MYIDVAKLFCALNVFILFHLLSAVEWDCAASNNEGIFTRDSSCTISGNSHVDVTNTLEIVGSNTNMDNLIAITAATNKRHFYVDNANAKLILHFVKLIDGDVSSYSSNPDQYGGSILIYENGGELNLYSSIVFNNQAKNGGGISAFGASSANKNAIMNIYYSIINNNELPILGKGGGIYMQYAVVTIYDTTIDNNLAYVAGGMYTKDSDLTMTNTIISNNYGMISGGIFINELADESTVVILRQSSFINNDATNYGDEIHTSGSPTISLISTSFSNPNNNDNIYDSGTPTWKTCSDNLCTETPYIGTCNPVDTTDPKLGVDCPGLNWIICGITYFNNYYLIGGQRNEASCQLCDKGTFNDIQGQSSCKQCDR